MNTNEHKILFALMLEINDNSAFINSTADQFLDDECIDPITLKEKLIIISADNAKLAMRVKRLLSQQIEFVAE